MSIAQCPPSLKAIVHYLKIAEDHDNRDIVVSYWCRLYGLEIAMQISMNSKTPEINKFLLSIMDWLENTKANNLNNECINNKICAQSYIENYSLKLFNYADEQDQAENYGKNVVKAFYTAGILMDVLSSFGDLEEDMFEKRKYAKWKAAYIHNCLKAGERPTPGSYENQQKNDFTHVSDDTSELGFKSPNIKDNLFMGDLHMPAFPTPPANTDVPKPSFGPPSPGIGSTPSNIISPVMPIDPSSVPSVIPPVTPQKPTVSYNDVNLNPEVIQKAQKYCKWASSALNYDDVKTAVDNLQKALILLQTGKDSPE